MTLTTASLNGWLSTATSWCIMVLMVGAIALSKGFAFDLPYVANTDPYGLALICAAFYAVTR
jgi:hypothetical protein